MMLLLLLLLLLMMMMMMMMVMVMMMMMMSARSPQPQSSQPWHSIADYLADCTFSSARSAEGSSMDCWCHGSRPELWGARAALADSRHS